jgi:RIO kinase 1
MNTNNYIEFFEDLDDANEDGAHSAHKRTSQKRESKKRELEAKLFIRAQEISREFQFTYKAARFEEVWLLDSLVEIAEHQWISDVLRKVKGGKEASVYLCKSGNAIAAPFVAAKIYRPRMLRNLKNDAQYRVGRVDLDEDGSTLWKRADADAIAKRSSYGEELRHQSWIAYEFTTMELLHESGADVPKPYAMEKNAIVMDFIGDAAIAAPVLNSVSLDRHEAQIIFDRVVYNIDILLAHNRIHGDLSAYNILYWNDGIKLIDFPQVVLPEENPAAWNILRRDILRVCEYFTRQGIRVDPQKLAEDLWKAHRYPLPVAKAVDE